MVLVFQTTLKSGDCSITRRRIYYVASILHTTYLLPTEMVTVAAMFIKIAESTCMSRTEKMLADKLYI
jgi:hypothetical protein